MSKFFHMLFTEIVVNFVVIKAKYNVSWADLQNCKEYYVEKSTTLNDNSFFQINTFKQNHGTADEILNLNLFVITGKDDIRIMLSSSNQVSDSTPGYEIVFYNRTYVQISREPNNQVLNGRNFTEQYVLLEPWPLTIQVLQSGVISVFVTGQNGPIISTTDSNLLEIKYISFSTHGDKEAKWFYDCDKSDSEIVELQSALETTEKECRDRSDELNRQISDLKLHQAENVKAVEECTNQVKNFNNSIELCEVSIAEKDVELSDLQTQLEKEAADCREHLEQIDEYTEKHSLYLYIMTVVLVFHCAVLGFIVSRSVKKRKSQGYFFKMSSLQDSTEKLFSK